MSVESSGTKFSNSSLCWTTTPVETEFPIMTGAISANAGILVYEDTAGEVRQIVDLEFKMFQIMPIVARKFLTSGTITKGAGTGGSVTTTATNVRAYW